MRVKVGAFVAAMLLVIAGGYVWQQTPNKDERRVILTVTFTKLAVVDEQVTIRWHSESLPNRNARPHVSPWTEKINVPIGDVIRLDAERWSPGTLSCLIQILPSEGFADTDSRASMGGVSCIATVR